MRSKPQTLAVHNESARARGGRCEPLQDGVHAVHRAPAWESSVTAADSRLRIDFITLNT
jgi:hypothetical protein